jgi:hypothetical protein
MEISVIFILPPLYPWGKSHENPLVRLDGPTASLDAAEKRKISDPCQELNPDSSAIQPVA